MIVKGGQNVYGQAIGILMLETSFPRIPGDMGNATTWNFPVAYRIVKGATPDRVLSADTTLSGAFIDATRDLENVGVKAVTTCCGFLSIFQEQLANAVNIPVFTSSLMQVPLAYRMLKSNQRVGIITINSRALTTEHLAAVGADLVPTAIVGAEEEDFATVLRNAKNLLDVDKARNSLITVARRLISQHPEVGAIVLECTNMPPYAKSIQEEVNLPVFDIYTLTNMVYSTVVRKDFVGYM